MESEGGMRLGTRRTLVLFDVDGTLAVPAQRASDDIIEMLARLRERYAVGIVGAGDYKKQEKQLGGPSLLERLDFCFSENGVHAFKGTKEIHCKSIVDHLGAARWASFEAGVREVLEAERAVTAKLLQLASPGASLDDRSMLIERRQCTANICPIGRMPALSQAERGKFDAVDAEDGMRRRVVEELLKRFGPETEFQLTFSIGGQIGIDVCPCGWDKTFCLQFVPPEEFDTIHFFGDKTHQGESATSIILLIHQPAAEVKASLWPLGGGDYEIFQHPRTIGHTVTSAADTLQQVKTLFLS